tara:strand:+ start:185 stop:484 length:300 start_codon:yes stop_codon:yes gene_type:complete
MKKIKFLIIFLILYSCNSLSEVGSVLRNEKIRTTDEFLVKKRAPLVIPPEMEKIPEPGSKKVKKIDEKDKIRKILQANDAEGENKSSSVEDSILNQIRK